MSPEDQVIARLNQIEAAVVDLKPFVFGKYKAAELGPESLATRRYRNRVLDALLQIYHLEAEVNRLARRRGLRKGMVADFIKATLCVRICWRAANTHKHGVGGRAGNATLPNAVITVVKDAKQASTPGEADAIVVGMVVSDADEGSFTSQGLIDCAIREWVAFLESEFGFELSDWLAKCLPTPKGPTIRLGDDPHTVVPPGSVVSAEIPKSVRDVLIEDMKKRREDS